jgi:cytochrome c5
MYEIHAKRGGLAWLLLLGALTGGCEEWWGEEEDPDMDASTNPSVTDAAAEAGPADAGLLDAAPSVDGSVLPDAAAVVDAGSVIDAAPSTDAAPVTDAAPAVDTGAPDAAAPATDAAADAAPEAAAPGTELPCDVAQVLEARCQSCHGQPLAGGPMPLITLADLRADSPPPNAGTPVSERVQVRIDSTTMPMPPTWGSTGALTSAEKATLTNWIAAGTPGSNNVCP